MRNLIIILITSLFVLNVQSQSCEELMEYVKSSTNYPTTYSSPMSDAIRKVSFYTVRIDYKTYYFAIVCFKRNEYSINCEEYLYQVASNTKMYYSMNYLNSAGEAFWEYIQPYADQLGCSPRFN